MELSRKFVSESVVRHTARQQARRDRELAELYGELEGGGPGFAEKPAAEYGEEGGKVSGVIAILDISGFTVLCEKASTDDTLMEELCRVINLAFSKEIEVVEKYGGEVLCFLGDGLLVFWPDLGEPGPGAADPWAVHRKASAASSGHGHGAPPSEASNSAETQALSGRGSLPSPSSSLPVPQPLSPATGRGRMAARAALAVQCALHVQEVFSEACVGWGADMKLRVAVAAGTLREYCCGIGGATSGEAGRVESALMDEEGHVVPGRMVHFLAGPAIEEAGDALSAIKAGEVAVCASARQLLPAAVLPHAARTRRSASADAPLPSAVAESAAAAGGAIVSPHPYACEGLPSADARADSLPLRLPQLDLHLGKVVAQPVARVVSRGRLGSALSTLAGAGAAPPLSPPSASHVVAPPAARRLLDAFVALLPAGSAALPASVQLGTEEQDALALYVPYSVRARFDDMREWAALSGPQDFDPTRFLSEFRVVSVVFMKLEGLEPSQAGVQRAVSTLQAVLYSYEGSLRQIVLDDKGMVMIGVFGLWPFAHEDDPARAVACAVDMQASMRAMGVNTHVGITTGLVFCTFVGSSSRCEFSVFGSVVNRAARLMSKSEGSVYTDQKTYAGCRGQLKMEHVGDFQLKGIDDKVPVFRPVVRGSEGLLNASSDGRESSSAASGAGGSRIAFVARAAETARVEALVASAASRPEGAPGHGTERSARDAEGAGEAPPPFLLYEGPSGSGKSTLCGYGRRVAEGLGMTVVASAGRSNRARQPWFLWRAILRQLFPLGSLDMGPILDDADFELLPALASAMHLDSAAGHGPEGASDFGAKRGLRRGSAVARAQAEPPQSRPQSALAPKRRVTAIRKKSIRWIATESLTIEMHMGAGGSPAARPSVHAQESIQRSLFAALPSSPPPPSPHGQCPSESPPPPPAVPSAPPASAPQPRRDSAPAASPAPFAPPPRPSGPLVNGNRRGSILAPDISPPATAPAAVHSNVRLPPLAPYSRRSAAGPPPARRYSVESVRSRIRTRENSDDEASAAVDEPVHVELVPLTRFLAVPWVPSPEGSRSPTARRQQPPLSCDPRPSSSGLQNQQEVVAVFEISKKATVADVRENSRSKDAASTLIVAPPPAAARCSPPITDSLSSNEPAATPESNPRLFADASSGRGSIHGGLNSKLLPPPQDSPAPQQSGVATMASLAIATVSPSPPQPSKSMRKLKSPPRSVSFTAGSGDAAATGRGPSTAAQSAIAERRRRGSGVTMTDVEGAQTARGFVARTRKGSVQRSSAIQGSDLPTEYSTRALHGLIAKLVTRRAATGRPVLLVLEDVHHADSQSWAVLASLLDALAGSTAAHSRLAVVVTCRPIATGTPVTRLVRKLIEARGTCVRVELGPLSEADTEALVRAAIGAQQLPRAVPTFIRSQTEGLPMLVTDLARSLLQDGSIEVDAYGGVYVKKALRRLKPTDGARAALVTSLDRLTSSQAMTLKLGSVVGIRFSVAELLACHPGTGVMESSSNAAPVGPMARKRGTVMAPVESMTAATAAANRTGAVAAAVGRDLAALVQRHMIAPVARSELEGDEERVVAAEEEPDGADALDREYEFVQPLLQEVVYTLMPVTERRALHLKLALHHEERLAFRGGLSDNPRLDDADIDLITVLAYHYELAGEEGRACTYIERCASTAHAQYANLEAARLYEDLLRMGGRKAPRETLVRWLRCYGEVQAGMDLHAEAVEVFLRGMDALGRHVPRSSLLRSASFAWNIARVVTKRPPKLHEYMRAASRNKLSPEQMVEEYEAMLILQGGIYESYMCSQFNLNKYLIAQAAWAGVSRCEIGPLAALGSVRAAQLCVLVGKTEVSAKWAHIGWSIAKEVDSPELWRSIMIPLGLCLIFSLDFIAAGATVAFFADHAFFYRDMNQLGIANALRALAAFRGPMSKALSNGVDSFRADLQIVLDACAKHPDILNETYYAFNQVVMCMCTFKSDPAAALHGFEEFLASRPYGGSISLCWRAAVVGCHAEAAWRALGARGRVFDGRSVGRVAVEACELAFAIRGSDVPMRLAEAADQVTCAQRAAYFCALLLEWDEMGGDAGLPAAVLGPFLSPATGPLSAHVQRKPSSTGPARAAAAAAPPPTAAELRAALLDGSRYFGGGMRRVRAVEALVTVAEGVVRSAKRDFAGARRRFERAAKLARARDQPRDAAWALLLHAAHEAGAGERAALAAAAAAAFGEAGDAFLARIARQVAAAAGGEFAFVG